MTTIVYIVLSLAIIIFVAYSVSRKRKNNKPAVIKFYPTYEATTLDLQIHRLINEYRINSGGCMLILDQFICDVAFSHSQYMVKMHTASHDYATERQQQFPGKRVGEIVAYNFHSAASVVTAWKASEDHDKIMKGTDYVKVGIAVDFDENGKPYFTAIFTS